MQGQAHEQRGALFAIPLNKLRGAARRGDRRNHLFRVPATKKGPIRALFIFSPRCLHHFHAAVSLSAQRSHACHEITEGDAALHQFPRFPCSLFALPCSYFDSPQLGTNDDRDHPHLLYPQFRQVAHPSIMITALVLHLWHIVAPGGKARAGDDSSDRAATGSVRTDLVADSPSTPARSLLSSLPGRLTSDFFF